jgi:hypothetical protein
LATAFFFVQSKSIPFKTHIQVEFCNHHALPPGGEQCSLVYSLPSVFSICERVHANAWVGVGVKNGCDSQLCLQAIDSSTAKALWALC